MTSKKVGRPPASVPPMKTRHIRLTDEQWETFKMALGAEWLRNVLDRAKYPSEQDKPDQ